MQMIATFIDIVDCRLVRSTLTEFLFEMCPLKGVWLERFCRLGICFACSSLESKLLANTIRFITLLSPSAAGIVLLWFCAFIHSITRQSVASNWADWQKLSLTSWCHCIYNYKQSDCLNADFPAVLWCGRWQELFNRFRSSDVTQSTLFVDTLDMSNSQSPKPVISCNG